MTQVINQEAISWCQSAATSNITKHCWSLVEWVLLKAM